MRPPSLDFHPADVLPLGELTLLWREVYANYPVPLPFTEDELTRTIEEVMAAKAAESAEPEQQADA